MKKFNRFKQLTTSCLLACALILPVSTVAQAAEKQQASGAVRYVTDSLEVPMRKEPGYKYKIVRMLRSGAPVQVLEVSPTGWVRVQYQTKNKTYEGWMPSILLKNQPIAKVQLNKQIEKTNRLEAENNQLKQELESLKKRFEETDKALKSIQEEKFKLDKAYQTLKQKSGQALELDAENKRLVQKLKETETQLILYKEQLSEAEDTVKRQWFLTGGGVLLLGIILGRFFRIPQRKNKWNSL